MLREFIILLVSWCVFFPVSAFSFDAGPVCAIDMGSNNFKLIIGEMKNGRYIQHRYTKDKLGVGADMSEANAISRSKLSEIRQILQKYLATCDAAKIPTRSAVATAAFREANNRRDVEEIAKSLHLPFQILSEERESQLAYLVGTLGRPNCAVIDNGSRSIELVAHGAHGYQWDVFNLGYEVAFQRFFWPAKTFAEASEKYEQALARYLVPAGFMKSRDEYVGVEMQHVGRDLLWLPYADDVSIPLHTVAKKTAALRETTEKEFTNLKQMRNIDAILPRLLVLEQTLKTFAYREIRVFERELGVGLIVEKGIQELRSRR
jgi:exopolyphosphatase/pppGpp-phosphohydrolase